MHCLLLQHRAVSPVVWSNTVRKTTTRMAGIWSPEVSAYCQSAWHAYKFEIESQAGWSESSSLAIEPSVSHEETNNYLSIVKLDKV
jgi:hypothetical protein